MAAKKLVTITGYRVSSMAVSRSVYSGGENIDRFQDYGEITTREDATAIAAIACKLPWVTRVNIDPIEKVEWVEEEPIKEES